jgi:hypothetical protein
MLPKAGIKVVDFGVARSDDEQTLTASPMAIGTPAYMSPEQRAGMKCDARSDIYALGVVLREMATGNRIGDLAETVPHLAHIVARCLENEPQDRWQAASDVSKELEWASSIKAAGPVPRAGRWRGRGAWAIAALAALAALGLFAGVALYRQRSAAPDLGRSEFILTLNGSGEDVTSTPVPSPDGRLLALVGNYTPGVNSIWIRPLDSTDARRLQGTEGTTGDLAWSPNGEWIAFYANGKLKKVRQSGGLPETIASIPGFQDAAWGSKGDRNGAGPDKVIRFAGGELPSIPHISPGRHALSVRQPLLGSG